MLEVRPADFATLLKSLHLVRVRARFLPVRHPSVAEAVRALHAEVTRLLLGRGSLTIVLQSSELFVNGVRCPNESIQFEDMVRELTELGVRSIAFLPGISQEELSSGVSSKLLAHTLEQNPSEALPHFHINEHVLELDTRPLPVDTDESLAMGSAMDTYQAAIAVMVGSYYDSRKKSLLNIGLVENMVASLHQGIESSPDLYFSVSQLREFSEYTFFHSVNVAILSMLLGMRVGLNTDQVRRLGIAAVLHDLGKSQIPNEILNKPGRLDGVERRVMEGHPAASVQILAAQHRIHPSAVAVAAQHHVGFDGKGYPNFAGFGALHLFSYIVTIADVYDALRSERSYKKAMLPDRAMLIMVEGMGTTFHPTLLKIFYHMVGPFPKGSLVELDSGEIGIVVRANHVDPFLPEVRLLTPGTRVATASRMLDLSGGDTGRTVLRCVDPTDYGVVAGRIV